MSESAKQLHLLQTQLSFYDFKQLFLRMTSNGDSLLFLNDSLFLLVENDFNSDAFIQLTKQVSVYGIDEQIEARGIKKLINNNIQAIDYQNFVKRCQNAGKVVSW